MLLFSTLVIIKQSGPGLAQCRQPENLFEGDDRRQDEEFLLFSRELAERLVDAVASEFLV